MTSPSINQNLIVKTYEHNGVSVDVSFTDDAYFNATAAAKAFDKLPKNWLMTGDAQEYIEACSRILLLDKNQMVIVKMGAPEYGGGTWLHPKLAVAFARWLNVDFALWCDGIIESILKHDVVVLPTGVDPRFIEASFSSCLNIARLCGFNGNLALLSADNGTKALTGVSALALIGATHLLADERGRTYTPTELGKLMDPPLTPVKMNLLLEASGLQRKELGGWLPTDEAEGLFEWADTGKRHSNGTPVKQLRWFRDVLDHLAPRGQRLAA